MNKFNSNKINNVIEKKNIKTKHIFVLAGGQLTNGEVNTWVKERLDIAIEIKKMNDESIIYCIGGGTYHKKPIYNIHGHVIHESKSCSNYIINNGILSKYIKREWASYDTIANGFFSFTNFIMPLKITECVLITSEFHMERAKHIFNYFKKICDININIDYISANNNMDSELLILREGRERESIKLFKNNIIELPSLNKFIEWFYIKHNAYNCETTEKCEINEKIKKTY